MSSPELLIKDNFYPLENKKYSYLIPILKTINEYLDLLVFMILLISYLIVYFTAINLLIAIDHQQYTVPYQSFVLAESLPHLIGSALIIIIQHKRRGSFKYKAFKYTHQQLIIPLILFIYLDIQSIINLINVNFIEQATKSYEQLHLSDYITLEQFKILVKTALLNNSIYQVFITLHAISVGLVSINIVIIFVGYVLSPRFNAQFWQYCIKRKAQHQRISRSRQFITEEFIIRIKGAENEDKFYNSDLSEFDHHHALRFYRLKKNSHYNKQ